MLPPFYGVKKRLIAEKIIAQSHANSETYFPTITGMLHFCETPYAYLPEATIICSQFKGTSGRDIIQTQEINGPLLEQAEVCLRLVESWISRHFKLQGIKLVGQSALPKGALREAIINALIHRKYFIPGAVKVALYDNRLEIFSPGSFPGLVDINNLGDGTTFLRNPNIARIARKLGMIEKMGSGIKLILDSFRKANLRRPEFHEEGDFVKVVFYFEKVKDPKHSDNEALIKLARERGELTIAAVMRHLKISRNIATRRLGELVNQGILTRQGKGPSVRYLLVENGCELLMVRDSCVVGWFRMSLE